MRKMFVVLFFFFLFAFSLLCVIILRIKWRHLQFYTTAREVDAINREKKMHLHFLFISSLTISFMNARVSFFSSEVLRTRREKCQFLLDFSVKLNHSLTLMLISFIIHSLELKSERLEWVIFAMKQNGSRKRISLLFTNLWEHNTISLRFLNVY